MPFKRILRFGMVGGGPGAFIGAVHNRAATLDGLATLVAGAFSSDPDKSKASGADLGIAWDGDADRCFFIDDRGTFVAGDFLTALLAETLLRKHPGEAILYDVRASRAVPHTVERAGGEGEAGAQLVGTLGKAHGVLGRALRMGYLVV